MILLLDTSTPLCRLTLIVAGERRESEWEAHRELANGLLSYLEKEISRSGKTLDDVTGIGIFKGPGSFTGLRISCAVLNTLADAMKVPIIGETGDDWQRIVLSRLEAGENDHVVLPLYGGEAHITSPRK